MDLIGPDPTRVCTRQRHQNDVARRQEGRGHSFAHLGDLTAQRDVAIGLSPGDAHHLARYLKALALLRSIQELDGEALPIIDAETENLPTVGLCLIEAGG